MYCDYHVHTDYSDDSVYLMEDVVKDAIKTHYNDEGVLILSLFDFLLEENCLEN